MTSPEPDPGNDAATTLPAPDLEGESDHNMVRPWTLPSPRSVAMSAFSISRTLVAALTSPFHTECPHVLRSLLKT